jgi:hypothetical protein
MKFIITELMEKPCSFLNSTLSITNYMDEDLWEDPTKTGIRP